MTGDLRKQLAASLRRALDKSKVRQIDLARDVGISTKHLSQMLTGHVDGTLPMWDRLFAALDSTPRVLDADPDLRTRSLPAEILLGDQQRGRKTIPVTHDPDLEHEGYTDSDLMFDGHAVAKAIRLNVRDSDPRRVLLHETLHAALMDDLQRVCPAGTKGHEDFVRWLTKVIWDNGWRILDADPDTPTTDAPVDDGR